MRFEISVASGADIMSYGLLPTLSADENSLYIEIDTLNELISLQALCEEPLLIYNGSITIQDIIC